MSDERTTETPPPTAPSAGSPQSGWQRRSAESMLLRSCDVPGRRRSRSCGAAECCAAKWWTGRRGRSDSEPRRSAPPPPDAATDPDLNQTHRGDKDYGSGSVRVQRRIVVTGQTMNNESDLRPSNVTTSSRWMFLDDLSHESRFYSLYFTLCCLYIHICDYHRNNLLILWFFLISR